jgi:two-component system response regulator FlrC
MISDLERGDIQIQHVSPSDLSDDELQSAHGLVLTVYEDLNLLTHIQASLSKFNLAVPIIVRVDRDNFELGISAMRSGATTVVPTENFDVKEWLDILGIAKVNDFDQNSAIVFADPVSRNLLALTERVAKVDVTVLLEGATGTGKEVIARILHEASPRHVGPFIAFNCAAMPENLIEDMLFGHDKGSFTGASNSQAGLFEQAEGGTIFLDEIGEMPFHLQAKLLRILQERSITRLGGQKSIDLNIRVVAATNRNLKTAIYERTFREDLYFRLSAFKITLPTLIERPLDILPLAKQFINQQIKTHSTMTLTAEAERSLIAYTWPGNVRELQNVIIRAVVLAQHNFIDAGHLVFDNIYEREDSLELPIVTTSLAQLQSSQHSGEIHRAEPTQLSNVVQHSEYQTIMAALQQARNRDQAAESLGISTRTLRHKLQRLREQGMSVTRAYAR